MIGAAPARTTSFRPTRTYTTLVGFSRIGKRLLGALAHLADREETRDRCAGERRQADKQRRTLAGGLTRCVYGHRLATAPDGTPGTARALDRLGRATAPDSAARLVGHPGSAAL